MPRITEELLRRRAEHNNCEISTLEEISLHQQDIEKIEHLDKWCKNLKILYLQSNLIPKIENVSRLKKLEYLNLALNNITKIENLQGCEWLQKLDLTVNFVGDLLSVESLLSNEHLHEIFLTGNPCTDYVGYREFVIATLPQLHWLDGKEINKSERIVATQKLPELRDRILEQQTAYESKLTLEKQKEDEKAKKRAENQPGFDGRWYTDVNVHNRQEAEEESFMDEPTAYTPESRIATHHHIAKQRSDRKTEVTDQPKKRERKLVADDGRVLNINEGKYEFDFKDNEMENQFELDLACPRFMDTSLIDCTIEPTHVRVKLKGKIFQLVMSEEVSPDCSSVKRSQTTGHLLVIMPKVKEIVKPVKTIIKQTPPTENLRKEKKDGTNFLEVDTSLAAKKPDIYNVVASNQQPTIMPLMTSAANNSKQASSKALPAVQDNSDPSSSDFIDDPDVPPLI